MQVKRLARQLRRGVILALTNWPTLWFHLACVQLTIGSHAMVTEIQLNSILSKHRVKKVVELLLYSVKKNVSNDRGQWCSESGLSVRSRRFLDQNLLHHQTPSDLWVKPHWCNSALKFGQNVQVEPCHWLECVQSWQY